MKRIIVVFIVCCLPAFSFSHSGRTDSSGGHNNRKTGEYHYHSGGASKGKSAAKSKSSKSTKKKSSQSQSTGDGR